MRLARFTALASLVAGGIVLACGQSATTMPEAPDDGAAPSVADGGGADTPDDAGKRSPSGCRLLSTGFATGSRAESVLPDDAPNAIPWTGVDGALEEDGAYATVTLEDGQAAARLRISGFGLAIPDDEETWGVEVSLTRRAPDGGIEDDKIELGIEGKHGRFKYAKSPWPVSAIGTHVYGQAIDTWGVDLFPADVNASSFAVEVSIQRAADARGPVTALVDAVKVAVHHCK